MTSFIEGKGVKLDFVFESDDKRVRQLQGAIRLAKARVLQYEKEKQDRLDQINEASHIDIKEEIISLNLINII